MATPEVIPETPQEQKRGPYVLKQGEGISNIGNELGIRQQYLESLKIGDNLRAGDSFEMLVSVADGSATLMKTRNGKLNGRFHMPRESIYQDTEKGPESFPYVSFIRTSANNTYKMVGQKGEEIGAINIPATNLDQFKQEITKVSGKLITECGSRKEQSDLACSIKPIDGFGSNAFTINSKDWYDFLPTSIDVSVLSKLSKSKGEYLVKALAKSIPLK